MSLSRRQFLEGTPMLLLPSWIKAAHVGELDIKNAIYRLRQLGPLIGAAASLVGTLEDTPKDPAAIAALERLNALEDCFDALSARIWQTHAASWIDVVARAEIASHWALRRPDGTLFGLDSDCGAERSIAQLLDAIEDVECRHVRAGSRPSSMSQ